MVQPGLPMMPPQPAIRPPDMPVGDASLAWMDPVIFCLHRGDPASLIGSLFGATGARLPARMQRVEACPAFVRVTGTLGASDIGVTAAPPGCWSVPRVKNRAPDPLLASIEADVAVWSIEIDLSWVDAVREDEELPEAEALRDALAALFQSDAAVSVTDQSESVHLYRAGWIGPHLGLPADHPPMIPARAMPPDVHMPTDWWASSAAIYAADPRLPKVAEVTSLDSLGPLLYAASGPRTRPPDASVLTSLAQRLQARCADGPDQAQGRA